MHPKLNVMHGGAGGAHGKADARPKPMKVLKDYVKNNRMRLFDFFSMMDKDKSMSLTITEFANGLKETGIPLTSDELIELVQKLDRDSDGEINYRFVLSTYQMLLLCKENEGKSRFTLVMCMIDKNEKLCMKKTKNLMLEL